MKRNGNYRRDKGLETGESRFSLDVQPSRPIIWLFCHGRFIQKLWFTTPTVSFKHSPFPQFFFPVTDGACTYDWCQRVPKIPFIAYLLVYVICFGVAFPYIGNSIGVLFTEVLGPRQQGTMQGVFAFVGSVGRCLAPLVTT